MIQHARRNVPALDDGRLSASLAAGAAQVLQDLRVRVVDGAFSGDATELRDAGDAAAEAYLAAAIARARPDDAILSEEARDDHRRLSMDRVWIVDPLDGTREFAERDADGAWRTDFAVHVALWVRGRGITDAAVALPGEDRTFDTGTVHDTVGTRRDGRFVEAVLDGHRPLRLAASRTRPPAVVIRLAERADVELVPMGSTGAKAMAVVDGQVDAYIHAGGQYEWDSAAPVAVARAAGLVATRLDGSEPVYNQADPWSPDLLICHPALADHLRGMLATVGDEDGGTSWR